MLPVKEIHYFDRDKRYSSPSDLTEARWIRRLADPRAALRKLGKVGREVLAGNFADAKWHAKWGFSNYSDSWYLSLFDYQRGKLTGEITPSYSILDEGDVRHMSTVVGDARIIFLMRNPIDRAWSMLRYSQKRGASVDLADTKALIKGIDSPAQELRSNYERTLEIYCRHFDAGRILVGFYDAIKQQPGALLSSIVTHIKAEDTSADTSVLTKRYNASSEVEMPKEVRDCLISKYRNPMESLSARFGGYATAWLEQIDNPQDEPSGELHPAVPYL